MNLRLAFLLGAFYWLQPTILTAQGPFFSEDFSNAGFPIGWTTSDDSGNPPEFLLNWKKCDAGSVCAPTTFAYWDDNFDNQPLATATAANGYLFANSLAADLPNGSDLNLSRLTSVPIDCSDKESVILYFESHIGISNTNFGENATLRVSTDGNNWTNYQIYPILNQLMSSVPHTTNPAKTWIDISQTAALEQTVFLQWQWTGIRERSWALDDIKLFEDHPIYSRAIWGTGPNEGLFEDGLTGWTTNIPLVGNVEEDPWKWVSKGYFGNAASANDGLYLSSPSMLNGAASFNADFYTTDGVNTPSEPFPKYANELISPAIDLSNVDKQINLQFSQSVRLLNKLADFPSQTAFAYSIDDGLNWSNWSNPNQGVPINGYWQPNTFSYPLPEEVWGATNFRVKFLFNGDLYGWVIDDVLVVERIENDLVAQPNFYAITPSLQTPISMVSPIQFLLDIKNEGTAVQPNTEVVVEVFKGTNEMVFQESLALGAIEPDSLVENITFSNSYLPDETGNYYGRYYVRSDSTDANPYNDTLYWDFVVNDSIFAKELGFTGSFTPNETYSYSYGNCFYLPPGEVQKACLVTFGIDNPGELLGRKVNIITYEIPEGDANEDLEITPDEYVQVAFSEYTFSGTEGEIITVPINFNSGYINLLPDTYYGVLIRYQDLNEEKRCYIKASQKYDFQATYVLYEQVENPRYFTLLDLDNAGTLNIIGLGDSGFDRIPVVRLHTCIYTNTTEVNTPLPFTLYPNPASNFLFLEMDFSKAERLVISNSKGEKVLEQSLFSSSNKQVSINISHLSDGIYFFAVYDKAGIPHYQKFVRLKAN